MTILIIEDDAFIRCVITEILEDEGYLVAGATNGREALDYLHRQIAQPELILLDLSMPVMTGWQFREEQQHDPLLAGIPVIVMSALPNLRQRAAALKATGCLGKPVDIGTLIGTVARHYHEGGLCLELGGSQGY